MKTGIFMGNHTIRKYERFNLENCRMPVWSAGKEEYFGEAKNISRDGFMLLTAKNIENGKKYTLEIELPDGDTASVNAECIWFSEIHPGQCSAGFHINEITEENLHKLDDLLYFL